MMYSLICRRWALVLLALLLAAPTTRAQQGPLRGFDAYLEKARQEWQVPGVAVAVVKGDSMVYRKGFGTREAGTSQPVDGNTIFAIGSSSKAFTAAAVGMLVDEGKVEWDDRVIQHLPQFELSDPYITREFTVRDLLTHRSGLERGEFIWYAMDRDRDEILRRVRHLEPSWGFRSRYGYQNIMYLAAGQLIPAATGTSWDRFVEQHLFEPLGMSRSSTSVDSLSGLPNVASPHALVGGKPVAIPYRDIDNMGPAGSINASAWDVAQWVRMLLNEGSYEGRRLLKEETVEELLTPQTIMGGGGSTPPELKANFQAYGLGWFLRDYRGKKIVHHGGNIDGMTALVAMLPAEELGLVVLTSMNGSGLPQSLMYRVFDAYLGGGQRDWSAVLKARQDSLRARAAEREEKRVAGTTPTLELARYAGTYADPMNGELTVVLQGDGLVIRRGSEWIGDLEHWHYDTFRTSWRSPGLTAVIGRTMTTFQIGAAGKVTEVELQGIGSFDRVPEEQPATSGR